MMRRQRHASAALLVSSFHVTASSRKQNASHEKSGTAATPTRRHQQECAFLNCFSCRRSNLSSSKSITRYRHVCSGAVSSPVIVCVNDRPVICNVSAYASDCGRLLFSSFTAVKHVLLLVEPFWPPVVLRLPSRPGPKRLESGGSFSGRSVVLCSRWALQLLD